MPDKKPQAKTQAAPAQPVVQPVTTPDQTSTTNGFAIASLVLGIISVVFCWIPYAAFGGQIFPIMGGIFGILGLNKKYQTGRGMAIAGLITSIVALVIETIWVILLVIGAIALQQIRS